MLLISSNEDLMAIQMFLFLLVVFLILGLACLWHLSWPHLQPSHSQGGALRTTVHRLLKPVMATWVIRSKTCASRMRMTFLHYLQTNESECNIRSRPHFTHARTTTISRDGEASSLGRVFLPLLRLKGFCLDVLHFSYCSLDETA